MAICRQTWGKRKVRVIGGAEKRFAELDERVDTIEKQEMLKCRNRMRQLNLFILQSIRKRRTHLWKKSKQLDDNSPISSRAPTLRKKLMVLAVLVRKVEGFHGPLDWIKKKKDRQDLDT